MTEKRKRRSYDVGYKVEAVKLVTEQGYGVKEATRLLGIDPSLI